MSKKRFGEPIIKDVKGHNIYAKTQGQSELVNAIEQNDVIFITGPAGTGKAQPLSSKVLTPNGIVTMGDIKVGDNVISVDGSSTKVIGTFPQGIKDIYKVTFDDGSSTKCCKEHLWEVRNERDRAENRPVRVMSLEELQGNLVGRDGRKEYSIPMVSPIEFNEIPVKLDPYTMGILIGDGHFNTHQISFSSADQQIVDHVSESLTALDLKINKDSNSNINYRIVRSDGGKGMYCKNNLLEYTKELNIFNTRSNNKVIPNCYLFNSLKNRIALLQGLMDSDGCVDNTGYNCEFTTVSKTLADNFKFLVQSLGGKVSITTKIPSYKYKGEKLEGQLAYRIIPKFPKGIMPFRLQRKVERFIEKTKYVPVRYIVNIEYSGSEEAKCILIDHPRHLYVTDECIVTHNTFLAIAMAVKALKLGNYELLKLTRPIVEAEEELGFLPGDLEAKVDPFMRPLYDSIDTFIEKAPTMPENVKKTKKQKSDEGTVTIRENIEICPLAYMRGRTFKNSIIILDEAQNTTVRQMKMFLSRMGSNSKIIITGDTDQIDLPRTVMSGMIHAVSIMEGVENLAIVKMDSCDIVRNPMVKSMLERYNESLSPLSKESTEKLEEDKAKDEVIQILKENNKKFTMSSGPQ